MSQSPQSLTNYAAATWDAVVIGAGPAGAMAAIQLARRGLRTLLVDAKRFPRAKVCGGCLNRRGIEALRAAGLAHVLVHCKAAKVHHMLCIAGRQRTKLALPDMCVIDRASFDHALVEEAIHAGAKFLDGTQAYVEPQLPHAHRLILATRQNEQAMLSARVAICADGISRSSLRRLVEFRSLVAPNSRIGVGAAVPDNGSLPPDEISMIVGRDGYVGLARSGSQQLNLAAALSADAVARSSISHVIAGTLEHAKITAPESWTTALWHGTPPLTSRPSRVAAERLFVIGDASGYVEPFSGEGMATALETAAAVAPLAAEAAREWRPALVEEWHAIHRRLVFDQQATCRQLAWILRQPRIAAAAVGICRMQPWVARRLLAKVS